MSAASTEANVYDEVPYPSRPLPQTHPDHLATVAHLFGMAPRPIDRCRVLDLGCSTGGNLMAMAERHPESTFLGIDYSRRQIEEGRKTVDALGLKNVELRQQSILDFDPQLGPFDYVISHGVFSWVASQVREKLLAICKTHLAPQGVAYVSFNAYPGWHARMTARELMCGYTPSDQPPRHRAARARKLLTFFSAALGADPAAHSRLLKDEIDEVLKHGDDYLVHEHFEPENCPLYFHEFAERASEHGLQYLGEAAHGTMFLSGFGAEVERSLLRISSDLISVEQHMDLLKNRAFRQTLLCHDDVTLVRRITPQKLKGLYFAGAVRSENQFPDLKSNARERFQTRAGGIIESISPNVKAALCYLGNVWPRAVSLDELFAGIVEQLGQPGAAVSLSTAQKDDLAYELSQCLLSGVLEIHTQGDSFVTAISEFPRASELARLQADSSPWVSNRRHEAVMLDEALRFVLKHLDGRHDRAALLRVFSEAVTSGRLSIEQGDHPSGQRDLTPRKLEESLDYCLAQIASKALLVG